MDNYDPEMDNLYKKAEVLFKKQDYDQALDKYKQFVKLWKESLSKGAGDLVCFLHTLEYIGKCYEFLKASELALKAYSIRTKFLEYFSYHPEFIIKSNSSFVIPKDGSDRTRFDALFTQIYDLFSEQPKPKIEVEEIDTQFYEDYQNKQRAENIKELLMLQKTNTQNLSKYERFLIYSSTHLAQILIVFLIVSFFAIGIIVFYAVSKSGPILPPPNIPSSDPNYEEHLQEHFPQLAEQLNMYKRASKRKITSKDKKDIYNRFDHSHHNEL